MSRKKYAVILRLFQIAPIIALLHILIFKFSISDTVYKEFQYPLYGVYLFFFILSLAIMLFLIRIKETKPEQIGFVFLVLITIKFALSYIFLRPILNSTMVDVYVEKINFFMIFIVFLVLEVILTSRLLNDK